MGAREATRRLLRAEMLPLLPAAVLVAVVIAWVATGGGYESQPALDVGYEPDPWYLGGLTLVALLCATAVGMGRVRMSRASKIACAALFGYVVWSFASILWAPDQGVAFLGSDRALVYLAAFLTFAILPWRDIPARVAMGALIGGIGAIAIVTAAKVATTSSPGPLYLGARLAYPLGYYNADAVMFMGAAAGAIALAAQRTTPAMLRVVGLSLAALCLQLAVLSQSRGWLFSAPIVLALMLLLIPGRLRLLMFALAAGAATAVVAPALLHVYGKATPGGETLAQPRLNAVLHSQGNHAVHTMLVADIVLAVLATIAVIADRRLQLSLQAQRRLDRTSRAVAVALALAGATVALVAVHGDVPGRVERAWKSFAHTPSPTGGGSSHFTTLASNRSDIWRVALREFTHNPLGGIGQDNFAASYVRLRHTYEQPRWTHSIELRLLTHTGLVGTLLFAAFLVAALMAALRGRRGVERTTAGIMLVFLVVWLVQGSIDWFWEYPALSVPALAFTAAAGALGRVGPLPAPPRRRRLSLAATLAAVLLGVGSLLALAIPFAAARRAREATIVWQSQPAHAYHQVRSASDLMPFDGQLYLLGASIALNLGEYPRARAWLLEAELHDDQNWLTPFALGLVEGEEGRLARATAQLRRAELLNPLEPAVGTALSRARERHPLSFAEAQALLAPHIATPGS
jgi:O-antigen ligase/polysaccharide polymerase Wzy-like membrane protein